MTNQYQIEIKGNGGELCIGPITKDAGDFWIKHPKEALLQHLNGSQENIDEIAKQGAALPMWHDNTGFAHEYGIESIGHLYVRDAEDLSKIYTEFDDADLQGVIEAGELEVSESFYNNDGYFLFSRSYEKGSCIVDLSTDEPFDISALKLHQVEFWDHTIIVGFSYNGERLPFTETFGNSYANNDFFLKAPDGKLWFDQA